MLESIIYSMSELILFCGFLCLLICRLFDFSPRQNIKLSFWLIIVSGFLKVVFYNKTFAEHYLIDNSFSTLVDILMYIAAISVLFLARRWYATNDSSPFVFCLALILSLLLGNILVSSAHFAVTAIAYCLILAINVLLIYHSAKLKENFFGWRSYFGISLLFTLIMLFITTMFYLENEHLTYESLRNYVADKQDSQKIYFLMVSTFLCFSFLLGLVPFNFWRTEILGQTILPVLAYFSLIGFPAYFAALINLSQSVFVVYLRDFSFLAIGISTISILIGALGACNGKNTYKILACGCLFHLGIMLLILNSFNAKAMDVFLIYLLIYLLSMYGIISTFFGLKSKGEYITTLSGIAGAADKKPYISAMITIYLFSLIGFPPFLGFISFYAVGLDLAVNNHYYILLIALISVFIITYAYMQIIKALYFEKSTGYYDHTERGIYAVMLINAVLMVLISLKPDILIKNLHLITENIFD